MPWKWGDPGGVAVSEQPELADSRKGKAVGRGRRKEEAVSFFERGMTNRAAALDAPDGVLTSCTGVLGSSRRTNDAGRDPVVRTTRPRSDGVQAVSIFGLRGGTRLEILALDSKKEGGEKGKSIILNSSLVFKL